MQGFNFHSYLPTHLRCKECIRICPDLSLAFTPPSQTPGPKILPKQNAITKTANMKSWILCCVLLVAPFPFTYGFEIFFYNGRRCRSAQLGSWHGGFAPNTPCHPIPINSQSAVVINEGAPPSHRKRCSFLPALIDGLSYRLWGPE